ncbi:MAG: GH3 auxin-responsive promoter family protein [Candidatus Bathyarchaeota archaeon]|nr:MAG: GH3 auxin-responsive promoter family protein [Candidatus Bathyarchaeota archaeon]
MNLSARTGASFLQEIVSPWYEALQNPAEAQQKVLKNLVEGYAKTLYGKNHGAFNVEGAADFRKNFPKVNYKGLVPYFEEVQRGNETIILSEPPVCWVMTRGSTGQAKVFPVTKTHIEQIFACGARALVNHALRKDDLEILTGKMLNLNFPSMVSTIDSDGCKITYGYSSGTYAKLNPILNQVSLLPRQEEIDALGPGITKPDWERRFDLVHERALNEPVVAAIGVTPVILSFGRYLKKRYGREPKELWKFRALICTSVRKIQFKYGPILRKHFGEIPIVEMYSATEGVFAQQLDDLPYITPNYDKYYFEVETSKDMKMLYELKRGEWGRLIISSCLFPRYDIGDMIEAMGHNYFRVFGRAKTLTILEHKLYRLLLGWFL